MRHVYIYNSSYAYKSSVYGMYDLLEYAEGKAPGRLSLHIIDQVPSAYSKGDYFILPALKAATDFKELAFSLKPGLIKFSRNGGILCSVCMSAFLLAETGVLDGRCATTHWQAAGRFKQLYPGVSLQSSKVIAADSSVITAGGLTAYNDLALHIIRNEFSAQLAHDVAHIFLLNSHRESQLPYSVYSHNSNGDELIEKLVDLCKENTSLPIQTSGFAEQLAISERQLQRRCRKSTGLSVAELFRSIKLDYAADLLVKGFRVSEAAYAIGYADITAFSRAFIKFKGMSPGRWVKM